MKNRRSCTIAGVLLGMGGLVLLLLAAGLYYYFVMAPAMLKGQRLAASPPSIIVHAPLQGDSAPEGSALSTNATASSRNPIARVELWWDGEIYQQQTPDPAVQSTSTTFYAESAVKMTAGTHLLYWRAVDNSGLVAQSPAIAVTGTPRLAGTEVVTAEEGQSLQDIADSLGGEPDVLTELNPNLGQGDLPAGTRVTVPVPPQPASAGEPAPRFGIAGNASVAPPPSLGAVLLPYQPPSIDIGPLIPFILRNLPAAPTNLQAGFEPCKVRLTWTDNATNETSFNIWLQPVGSAPFIVSSAGARPGTGDATFEFPAPRFGLYTVWVEAINALGRQASEMQGVFVNTDSCPQPATNKLEIQVMSITPTGGSWHDLYCFVSIEGATERRVPEDDSQFIQPGALLGGTNLIVIDTPADGELNLSGDCWGWPGPGTMGPFATAVPGEQWDNRPLHTGNSYDIDFRVRPFGSVPVKGIFSYTDSNLPVPTVVSVEPLTSKDPLERSRLARNVTLTWDWQGAPESITNFVIAWDEALEFKWANQSDRTAAIVLPYSCGGTYKFAVAAVASGGARSAYSTAYSYSQPPCDIYAQVDFLTFKLTSHDDGEVGGCDTAELIFRIGASSVNSVEREWQGEGAASDGKAFPYGTSTSCNQSYHVTQYPLFARDSAPGQPDSFTVLVEPSTSAVNVGATFQDMDTFIVPWDYDVICTYYRQIHVPYDQWIGYDKSFSETCEDSLGGERDGTVQLNYRLRGYRTPRGP
jgi:hypothetical protein